MRLDCSSLPDSPKLGTAETRPLQLTFASPSSVNGHARTSWTTCIPKLSSTLVYGATSTKPSRTGSDARLCSKSIILRLSMDEVTTLGGFRPSRMMRLVGTGATILGDRTASAAATANFFRLTVCGSLPERLIGLKGMFEQGNVRGMHVGRAVDVLVLVSPRREEMIVNVDQAAALSADGHSIHPRLSCRTDD